MCKLYFSPFFFFRKCDKPLKPKITVQIASDTGQAKETVQSIPIMGAHPQGEDILICHGTPVFLSFETIVSIYIISTVITVCRVCMRIVTFFPIDRILNRFI